jgi:TRAP transporter TAXI family solute receptor
MNIYNTLGIKINPVALSWADAVNSLKDGTIDAASFSGAHPFSSLVEVELTHPVTPLRIGKEDIDKLVAKDPTRPAVNISGKTYKYLDEDYLTLCEYSFAICNKDLPEDVAYALTKIALENRETLNIAVAAAKDLSPDYLGNITTAKLHPGAYRYYKEIGATVPESLIP